MPPAHHRIFDCQTPYTLVRTRPTPVKAFLETGPERPESVSLSRKRTRVAGKLKAAACRQPPTCRPGADERRVQTAFPVDDVLVVVATVAFGMASTRATCVSSCTTTCPRPSRAIPGDRPAGRDGLPAEALLLFGLGDAAWCAASSKAVDVTSTMSASRAGARRAAQAQQHVASPTGSRAAAGLLATSVRSWAQTAALRHLPRPARDLRRHRARADGPECVYGCARATASAT